MSRYTSETIQFPVPNTIRGRCSLHRITRKLRKVCLRAQVEAQEETTAEPASDAAGASANAETEPKAKAQAEGGQQLESEEEDEEEYKLQRRLGPSVKKGSECPYLDTISRQVDFCYTLVALYVICETINRTLNLTGAVQNLDFDFEKCCSVSLSPVNVYACLVCGKYFQVHFQYSFLACSGSFCKHIH